MSSEFDDLNTINNSIEKIEKIYLELQSEHNILLVKYYALLQSYNELKLKHDFCIKKIKINHHNY